MKKDPVAEPDMLGDLLTSNPNEVAVKGLVFLLRTEMKQELKVMQSELTAIKARLSQLESGVESRTDKSKLMRGKVWFWSKRNESNERKVQK